MRRKGDLVRYRSSWCSSRCAQAAEFENTLDDQYSFLETFSGDARGAFRDDAHGAVFADQFGREIHGFHAVPKRTFRYVKQGCDICFGPGGHFGGEPCCGEERGRDGVVKKGSIRRGSLLRRP